jgi:hypothetical protein
MHKQLIDFEVILKAKIKLAVENIQVHTFIDADNYVQHNAQSLYAVYFHPRVEHLLTELKT